MERIKEKLELINQHDNNLMNSNIKYLTQDIIKSYKQELKEWMTTTTHQKNIELYSTGVSPEEIWNRNSNRESNVISSL